MCDDMVHVAGWGKNVIDELCDCDPYFDAILVVLDFGKLKSNWCW